MYIPEVPLIFLFIIYINIPRVFQNLGISQNQRSRFRPIGTASYPRDRGDAGRTKDRDVDEGRNQVLIRERYKQSFLGRNSDSSMELFFVSLQKILPVYAALKRKISGTPGYKFLFLVVLIAASCTQPLRADQVMLAAASSQGTQGKQLIVIDAGHGGDDIGAQVKSIKEKALALQTATLIKQYLHAKGYRVILTRSRDVFLPLKKRTAIANDTKSKLFVSIHFNAYKSPQPHGIEIYYYNRGSKWRQNASKKLADTILHKMIEATGAKNRGVKVGNFHVIRETYMPAILIEGGFITNPAEHTNLSNKGYVEKMARSIATGIEQYLRS